GLTFRDLCTATGLKQTTVSNTLSARTANRRTRQVITNFCGIQLWDDVSVTERYIAVPSGASIEFSELRIAREWSYKLSPNIATRRGRSLTFAKPCTFAVEVKTQNRRVAAHSGKGSPHNKEFCRT
ncbi:MAG: hypothetical protein WCE87_01910, partial [Candidatus Udaeobacter sp.]